jgi:hypothetical protein
MSTSTGKHPSTGAAVHNYFVVVGFDARTHMPIYSSEEGATPWPAYALPAVVPAGTPSTWSIDPVTGRPKLK